ncbi:hypothetical protein ACP4OV_030177 [Aristida adscensionis]
MNSFEQNESTLDHVEHCKSLLSDLFSDKDSAFSEGIIKEIQGIRAQNKSKEEYVGNGSSQLFAEKISGLSKSNEERLKNALQGTVTILNDDVDKMHGQILATLKIKSENLLSNPESESDGVAPPCAKRQKTDTLHLSSDAYGASHAHRSTHIFEKVDKKIRAVEESGETRQEALRKFSAGLLIKLEKMAQGIEDLLNTTASKCRPMTTDEKIELAWRFRKLPVEALNRVVEIVTAKKPASQSSDKITMNLGELDDATLWRLFYHVEYVLKENKI